jgi:hypothetical protein
MSIDRDSASASLEEIAVVQRKTREALTYGGASTSLLVWGGVVTAGHIVSHFHHDYHGKVWIGILAFGLVFSMILHWIRVRAKKAAVDRRIIYAMLALVAFGVYWATLIGPERGREMAAFWPTVFMFGYVLAGFWLGRFFTICGLVVTVLTMVGYRWAGEWFNLWMAAVDGVALVGGGLWLRRTGSTT